jgi:hypothetical protein
MIWLTLLIKKTIMNDKNIIWLYKYIQDKFF